MSFPPLANTSLLNVIKSYLYTQYNDDDNVQSTVDSFNAYAQAYVDYLNNLQLPIYTSSTIAGPLLDWVATNLYGISRISLPGVGAPARGLFNTYDLDQLRLNTGMPAVPPTVYVTDDDYYKRILTWAFYRGDGRVVNPTWIKRRVTRFLNGANGADFPIDSTYPVSVTYTAPKTATITIPTGPSALIFQAAVAAGAVELPFQTAWTVTLV